MAEYPAGAGWSVNVIPIAFEPLNGGSPACGVLPLRGERGW